VNECGIDAFGGSLLPLLERDGCEGIFGDKAGLPKVAAGPSESNPAEEQTLVEG
jgi:hypothetical protein